MTTTVNDYTALLSGSYWNGIEVTGSPVIVTYSFPTSYPTYDTSLPLPPGFTSATAATFQAFTPAEQLRRSGARRMVRGVRPRLHPGRTGPGRHQLPEHRPQHDLLCRRRRHRLLSVRRLDLLQLSELLGRPYCVRRCVHEFAVPQRRHGQLRDAAARDRTCDRPRIPPRL